MLRFIIYTLIAIGTIASVPALRSRAAGPASYVYVRLEPYIEEVVDPIREQIAQREESAIAGELKAAHNLGRPLPDTAVFSRWVNERLSVGNDPWHNPYFLVVYPDGSAIVGSNGRDRLRSTDDDILLKAPW